MGKLYGLKGDYTKSVNHYSNAVKTQPRNITAKQNLAAAYISADLKENAVSVYEQIIKVDTKNWDAYYELGKLYISLNKKADAKLILEGVLNKNPNYPKAAEIRSILSSL